MATDIKSAHLLLQVFGSTAERIELFARALDSYAINGEERTEDDELMRDLAGALRTTLGRNSGGLADEERAAGNDWERTLRENAVKAMRPLYEGAVEQIWHACWTLEKLEHALDALVHDDDRRERVYRRTGGYELRRALARIAVWIENPVASLPSRDVVAPYVVRNALCDEIELIGLEVRDRCR